MKIAKTVTIYALLALLIGGAFAQKSYITGAIDELYELADDISEGILQDDIDACKRSADIFYERWNDHVDTLSGLLDHEYVNAVYIEIESIREDIANANMQQLPSEAAKLKRSLSLISHLEKITLENIF